MNTLSRAALTLAILGPALIAPSAHAQSAYDPFNATPGFDTIATDNSGTGWAGSWVDETPGGTANSIIAGTITADGVDGSSNYVNSQNKVAFRPLTNTSFGSDTFFVSFLAQGVTDTGFANTPDYAGVSLFQGTNGEQVFLGNGYDQPNYGIAGTVQSGTSANTTAHFLVYQFQPNGSGLDTVSLFVDPSLTALPAVADATSSVYTFSFDTVRIASGFNASFNFDELRLGTTYASVVPALAAAPEPSQVAALGLGALGLLGLVACKRKAVV